MKIRAHAEAVGFRVIGRITYYGKCDLSHRLYMDEAGNRYLIDTGLGDIRIVPARRKRD